MPHTSVKSRARKPTPIVRVGYSEMPMCRAYGDVVAAALASQMEATTVRGARQVMRSWMLRFEEENGYIFS